MRGHWWSHTITFSRVDAARAGLVAIGLAALWWLVLVADAASIAAAAIGGVALWLVQRVVAHAKLSARATSATTIALFGIALVGAAVGGAVLARGRIVRFDGPVVTATFPTVPYAPLAMPDFTGIDANEADPAGHQARTGGDDRRRRWSGPGRPRSEAGRRHNRPAR